MEKDLSEGIKLVAQALNKHEVKYMFVGGVAISFYGTPSQGLLRIFQKTLHTTLTSGTKLPITTLLSLLVEYLK